MKIGFDGKRATHNFRGLGNYSRGIIEGLVEFHPEIETLLYTPDFKDTRAKNWLSLHPTIKIENPNSFIDKLFPSMWRSLLLEKEPSFKKLDIYHGLSHELPFLTNTHLPVRRVVTIHDLIFLRYPEFFPWIDRQVYYSKFKKSSEKADVVIAICEQTKNDLVHFLGIDEKKIEIHYQSCDPIFYENADDAKKSTLLQKLGIKKPYILNVGAFEARKNQLTLVKSFNQIKHKIEHDLILVGNGKTYQDQVIHLINELQLNARVKIINTVAFQDLPTLYQSADLFCFPSFFEGFGIPITEALFSKVPVITSHGSCFPESAGPHSVFIDPNSIDELSNAIDQVLSNEDQKNLMVKHGHQYVQRFNRKQVTDNLVDIYTRLLS